MRLTDVAVPDSAAAKAALEVATAYCSPALLNHSIRAYLWGIAYAQLEDLAYDNELLYVSAMLHDLGLIGTFDSHTVDFEYAGGNVAWVFGAAAGWPVERRQRAADVIIRHMWDEVDPAFDPEGHILCASTGMDISGRRANDLPEPLRTEVLASYPRLDLAPEFTACFADQATRKPKSSAADAVRSGLATRIAANPLDS
jgi:hypothetical protein